MTNKPYSRTVKSFALDIVSDIRSENPYVNVNFPDVGEEWLDAYAIICSAINEAARIFKESPEVFAFMNDNDHFEIMCKGRNENSVGFSKAVDYITNLAVENKWEVLQSDRLIKDVTALYHLTNGPSLGIKSLRARMSQIFNGHSSFYSAFGNSAEYSSNGILCLCRICCSKALVDENLRKQQRQSGLLKILY